MQLTSHRPVRISACRDGLELLVLLHNAWIRRICTSTTTFADLGGRLGTALASPQQLLAVLLVRRLQCLRVDLRVGQLARRRHCVGITQDWFEHGVLLGTARRLHCKMIIFVR